MPSQITAEERRLLDAIATGDAAREVACLREGTDVQSRPALFELLVDAPEAEVSRRLAWAERYPHLIRPTLATLGVLTTALLDRHTPAIQDRWIQLLPHYLFLPNTQRARLSPALRYRYAHTVTRALAEAADPTVWVRAQRLLAGSPLLQDARPIHALRKDRPDRLDVPRLQLWVAEAGLPAEQLRQGVHAALDAHFAHVDRLPRSTWLAQTQWLLDHGADLNGPVLLRKGIPERFHTDAPKRVHLRELALVQQPSLAPTRSRSRSRI